MRRISFFYSTIILDLTTIYEEEEEMEGKRRDGG